MDLKGHKRGLHDLAFNEASNLILTSSKDGTIRLYNIDVRYNVKEDPKLLEKYEAPDVELCSISQSSVAMVQNASLKFFGTPGFAEVAQPV